MIPFRRAHKLMTGSKRYNNIKQRSAPQGSHITEASSSTTFLQGSGPSDESFARQQLDRGPHGQAHQQTNMEHEYYDYSHTDWPSQAGSFGSDVLDGGDYALQASLFSENDWNDTDDSNVSQAEAGQGSYSSATRVRMAHVTARANDTASEAMVWPLASSIVSTALVPQQMEQRYSLVIDDVPSSTVPSLSRFLSSSNVGYTLQASDGDHTSYGMLIGDLTVGVIQHLIQVLNTTELRGRYRIIA